MLRIAICDDERIHRRHTAELIDSALAARSADISCFDSSEALLQTVVSGYAPDIAVLDIQMGEMDGISLAKRLNALTPSCRIIFVTSYLAFATEVYSTEHVYFILKSQIDERIGSALEKAVSAIDADRGSGAMLPVKVRGGTELIPVKDVKYVERLSRKTHVVAAGSELWSAHAPAELLSGHEERFIRCHQSMGQSAVGLRHEERRIPAQGRGEPADKPRLQAVRAGRVLRIAPPSGGRTIIKQRGKVLTSPAAHRIIERRRIHGRKMNLPAVGL